MNLFCLLVFCAFVNRMSCMIAMYIGFLDCMPFASVHSPTRYIYKFIFKNSTRIKLRYIIFREFSLGYVPQTPLDESMLTHAIQ